MISSLYKTKTAYLFMCPLLHISRSVPLLVTGNDGFFTSRGKDMNYIALERQLDA